MVPEVPLHTGVKRIHIFGASGSGTTTLAQVLAKQIDCIHFDSDDYFWIPTNPRFEIIREVSKRQAMLKSDLESHNSWVLSGSLCGWGDFIIPMVDLMVFLWLPSEIRMKRLQNREIQRYGPDIVHPDHPRNNAYKIFMKWAAQYDIAGLEMRSKARHKQWIAELPCPVVRLEGDLAIDDKLKTLTERIAD